VFVHKLNAQPATPDAKSRLWTSCCRLLSEQDTRHSSGFLVLPHVSRKQLAIPAVTSSTWSVSAASSVMSTWLKYRPNSTALSRCTSVEILARLLHRPSRVSAWSSGCPYVSGLALTPVRHGLEQPRQVGTILGTVSGRTKSRKWSSNEGGFIEDPEISVMELLDARLRCARPCGRSGRTGATEAGGEDGSWRMIRSTSHRANLRRRELLCCYRSIGTPVALSCVSESRSALFCRHNDFVAVVGVTGSTWLRTKCGQYRSLTNGVLD